jgi:integral membrane protein
MTTARRLASHLLPGYVRSDGVDPTRGLRTAVLRYRAMAYIVGTGLLVLVLIGVPLQFAAGLPKLDAIVGPIHGFLYIIYLFAAFDLARRARFTMVQMFAMLAAGLLPFVAFVIERSVVKRLRLSEVVDQNLETLNA